MAIKFKLVFPIPTNMDTYLRFYVQSNVRLSLPEIIVPVNKVTKTGINLMFVLSAHS